MLFMVSLLTLGDVIGPHLLSPAEEPEDRGFDLQGEPDKSTVQA